MEHEAGEERKSRKTVPKVIAKYNERVRYGKENKRETAAPVAQRESTGHMDTRSVGQGW